MRQGIRYTVVVKFKEVGKNEESRASAESIACKMSPCSDINKKMDIDPNAPF